jgi:hypothetical protein
MHPQEMRQEQKPQAQEQEGQLEQERGMFFETFPSFYPPTFQEEYSDTSTDIGSKYSPPMR